MAKTPLFRTISKAIRQASASVSTGISPVDRSRRSFIKSGIITGLAAAPLSHILLKDKALASIKASPTTNSNDPVIILGGGVSGLTVAYRLMKAGISCEIYEADTRLGGRILTKRNFNNEGMFAELGGEFMDSGQTEILSLGQELGVEIDDYHVLDPKAKAHQFFFNGKRYFDEDLAKSAAPLARRLLKDMKQVFPDFNEGVLTYKNFKPSSVKFDRMTLAEYLDSMRNDVEKWVLDAVGIAYVGEFGNDLSLQSAINLMTLVDLDPKSGFPIFGESDESIRFKGGNCSLIEALQRVLESKVKIHLDRKLVKINRVTNNSIEMTFTNKQGSNVETRKSSQVVCTIPFPILRSIEGIGKLGLSSRKMQIISSLGYGVNSKNIIGFKERPWRKIPGVTDSEQSGYTFADVPAQTFWDMSRAQKGKSGILTNFIGGTAALLPDISKKENVLNDANKLFPGVKSTHDGRFTSFGWCAHPYSNGSYACPCPGQYTTILGAAEEPELDGRLLFCGEHVSVVNQGYMNGAVETGNVVAMRIIAKHKRRGFLRLQTQSLFS